MADRCPKCHSMLENSICPECNGGCYKEWKDISEPIRVGRDKWNHYQKPRNMFAPTRKA